MPHNAKDGVRKQERKVYVVIHNEETEITSLQTAASALPHQADISEKKMEILDKWADLRAHSYYNNKSTTFKCIQIKRRQMNENLF